MAFLLEKQLGYEAELVQCPFKLSNRAILYTKRNTYCESSTLMLGRRWTYKIKKSKMKILYTIQRNAYCEFSSLMGKDESVEDDWST